MGAGYGEGERMVVGGWEPRTTLVAPATLLRTGLLLGNRYAIACVGGEIGVASMTNVGGVPSGFVYLRKPIPGPSGWPR